MREKTQLSTKQKRILKPCKSARYVGDFPALPPYYPTDRLLINPLPVCAQSGQSPEVGLSYYLNLHAEIVCRSFQNGENLIFTRDKKPEISGNNEIKAKKSDITQSKYNELLIKFPSNFVTDSHIKEEQKRNSRELTGHAKRCIRITADKYQELILTDTWKQQKINNKAFCSFITLTYRRIYPLNTRHAKMMLRAFFMRLQRYQAEPLYYTWIAERQTGKYLNNLPTYRLQNKESIIHFHILTPYYFDKHYINRAWNETVINHFLKFNQINEHEAETWRQEVSTWEQYYKRLERYKAAKTSREPKRPSKSKFLLMPNIRAVYNAGRYMAKYMSKAGGTAGNIWGVSTRSREYLTTQEYKLNHINTASASMCINNIYQLYKKANKKKYTCNFITPVDTSGFYVFKDKNFNLFLATLNQLFYFDINGNLIFKYKLPDKKQGAPPQAAPEPGSRAHHLAADQPPRPSPGAWEPPDNLKDYKFNQETENFFKLLRLNKISSNPNKN